jgi:hypothetical protein
VLLAVGFVNQLFAPELNLGVVDTDSGAFAYIYDAALAPLFLGTQGVNGLVRHRGHFLVGFQSAPTRILVLDEHLEPVAVHAAPEVMDLHSFAEHDGRLHCVSTGTDEVYALDFGSRFESLDVVRVYRRSGARPSQDGYHLNSIASCNGELLVTEFGRKHPNGWASTTEGAVLRTSDERALLTGIHHPHTLRSFGGGFALCESSAGRLWLPDGRVLARGGYLRGLDVAGERLIVGQSAQRLRSRSAGTLNVAVASRPELARSAIHVHRLDSLAEETSVDLSAFGTEVYELLVLPDDAPVARFFAASAFELRISAMQEQILALQQRPREDYGLGRVKAKLVEAGRALGRLRRGQGGTRGPRFRRRLRPAALATMRARRGREPDERGRRAARS